MNTLQAKNRIKEIDALVAELQQERADLEKYINERKPPIQRHAM